MEKIYKLLQSQSLGDTILGVNLLLREPEDKIVKFIKTFGRYSPGFLTWEIATFHNNLERYFNLGCYMDLGSVLFLVHMRIVRLRSIESEDVAQDWPILSKEEYLNELYKNSQEI